MSNFAAWITMAAMAFFRKDKRYDAGAAAGVKSLEEPMEATLADNGGLARITFSLSGSREAAGKWLTGTVEFAGFGVQVFLDDPLLKFDDVRELGQSLWKVSEAQEGDVVHKFEPSLVIRMRAPSKKSARLEVFLTFIMGTDAQVTAQLQTDNTLCLAFCEALERALEAIDDLR